MLICLSVNLALFFKMGLYRTVVRYISLNLVKTVFTACTISAVSMAAAILILAPLIPLTTPIIYAIHSMLFIGGIRFLIRSLYQSIDTSGRKRVIIYGAGDAGSQLVSSLKHGEAYTPVAFVDDWKGMQGNYVEGLRVHPPQDLRYLVELHRIQCILLAMPSVSRHRRKEILGFLDPLSLPVQTIPSISDIIAGRSRINEIQDVTLEDLLGRDPIPPDQDLLDANIRGKVVLVTGAGGSIGSELCRQILMQQPRLLLLLDIYEFALYQISSELEELARKQGLPVSIHALLGTVQHRRRMEAILRSFGVQTIYHAAAYKHVPMVEHNMIEGISNNVFGTLETALAAVDCHVETFVLVSTDKAVRPTNVMGTTKRLAELICQALASHYRTTRFCMVRFGNVLGSSGSVIPLFRRQIQQGGPITVTHPDITRYFMTIPEAAQLVIQAGAMGQGGDVFVLDMGEQVRISDLARQMVHLSGLEVISENNPEGDIEIVYTGLRPGEKLYEELLIDASTLATAHPRIMSAREDHWEWHRLESYLKRLKEAASEARYETLIALLQEAPTAYQPETRIADILWQNRKEDETRSFAPRASTNIASCPHAKEASATMRDASLLPTLPDYSRGVGNG